MCCLALLSLDISSLHLFSIIGMHLPVIPMHTMSQMARVEGFHRGLDKEPKFATWSMVLSLIACFTAFIFFVTRLPVG